MYKQTIILGILALAAVCYAAEDKPEQGSWNVTENGRTCILSVMGIRLSFNYTADKNETRNVTVDVPVNATTAESTCGATSNADEILQLNFNDDWVLKMTFRFVSSGSSNKYEMSDVALTFTATPDIFPGLGDNATYTVSLSNQTFFSTPNTSSYQCVSNSVMSGFAGTPNAPALNISTSDLRLQAFKQGNNLNFSSSVPCPADTEVSNIVPIAVGAALAALVVIVLIAYLIGRRKSKKGYESV